MNKELAKDTLEKLQVAVARFDASLGKIDLYGENHHAEAYDDIIEFLKAHQGHRVWLINDYFEGVDDEKDTDVKTP
jgi:hypothetical protein